MAGASTPEAATTIDPTVHNAEETTVTVRMLVHDQRVSAESVTLAPGVFYAMTAPPAGSVEVYTADGSATAPAKSDPLFVVRVGRVLVATW
jgi:hypothetical protein